MEYVAVTTIRIDQSGRLRVVPATNPQKIFQFIYRAAMAVKWDDEEQSLHTPVPQEWSYADWYAHVLAAVQSELGVPLAIDAATTWENVPPAVEQEIRRRIQTPASGETL